MLFILLDFLARWFLRQRVCCGLVVPREGLVEEVENHREVGAHALGVGGQEVLHRVHLLGGFVEGHCLEFVVEVLQLEVFELPEVDLVLGKSLHEQLGLGELVGGGLAALFLGGEVPLDLDFGLAEVVCVGEEEQVETRRSLEVVFVEVFLLGQQGAESD